MVEKQGASGHACGHHLFGAASVAAASALAAWIDATGVEATIKLVGTPAEEGGSGKVYLARAGVFDDVDVVLHWHPSDRNSASPSTSTANKSGRFTFKGRAAHAASAPHRGRSALDGVEAMNYMVNLMREHVPQMAASTMSLPTAAMRQISCRGKLKSITTRHPQASQVVTLFERVVKAAEAAAMGTETEMSFEVMHGNYPVMPNHTLARLVHDNLEDLGGIKYKRRRTAVCTNHSEKFFDGHLPLGSERYISLICSVKEWGLPMWGM
ncbi:MAG: hypothetical protein CM15mP120_17330 [Pseudomonadota bacterium]|nr:MAG: hypothetical protein CM15mP120_17330 [Pseudomonadota bacterium]